MSEDPLPRSGSAEASGMNGGGYGHQSELLQCRIAERLFEAERGHRVTVVPLSIPWDDS